MKSSSLVLLGCPFKSTIAGNIQEFLAV